MNLTELDEQSLHKSITSKDENQTEDVPFEEDEKFTLFEKLKHNKWQIRRKAYVEITDLIGTQKFPIEVDGDLITLESITPILQNLIYEQNLIALSEGLKAVKVFLTHYTLSRSHLTAFATSLIEKLVLTKKSIQQLVLDIFDKLIEMDDIGCVPSEVLKRLDTKNHKFINSVLSILLKYFKVNTHIEDFSIRTSFKMMLPMMSHSNKETRAAAYEILKILYSFIEETYEDLLSFGLHDMRSYHLKELEMLQKCPKSKSRKLLKLNDGSFRAEKKHQHSETKVDLATLMPEKYLEIPYMVQNQQDGKHFTTQHQQNEKKKKLEEFNAKIETTLRNGLEIDSNKDYSFIINLMIVLLEDKNILINQEATKTITYLIRICKGLFPLAKLKHILTLIVEKINIKKKTTYNTSLYNVFDEVLICKCIHPDTFCDLLLTYAETSKNMNAKIASLHWFGTNFISFLTDRREILSNLFNETNEPKTEKISISANVKQNKAAPSGPILKPEEKIVRLVTSVYKRVQQILKKEQNHAIKKLSQEVLDVLQQPEATYQGSHNIPVMPSVSKENQNDISNHINDISSIKHSRVVNISNITIPQMDSIAGDRFDTEDLQYTNNEELTYDKGSHHEASKRSEFSLENLKPEEKDQLGKLMTILNDIRGQDEHIIEKLEAFITLLEKTNMQVIQTCQVPILKKLKKILYTNSSDRKNIINFFDTLHTILIKINRICLELLPQTVKTQLKMLILFLSNIMNNKQIEKILDSAYMTCSPDKFLSITLKIFEKIDKKYTQVLSPEKLANSLRIYLNWLAVKIEKIQSVMMEENQLKFFEHAFNQFRFTNLPQVHLGIVAILSKKHRQIDDDESTTSKSRTFETPRIRKQKQASDRFDEENDQPDLENGISDRLKNIETEIHSNLHAGLLKFSSLLSSIKKKNLERSSVTGQNTAPFSSPNRGHWKRGVGREGGTPGKKSVKGPLLGHGEEGKGKSPLTSLSIDEVSPIIESICSYISDQETVVFDDLMYKLKCICSPKELMQVFKVILTKLLAKDCYGQRLTHEKVLQILVNFCENLEKGLILSTLKEFFQLSMKSSYRILTFNTAKVCLDLTTCLFNPEELPKKLISNLVEILVYSLSEPDLKEQSESILFRLLGTGKREDLRKIFEVELLNSFKLYQVFLYWLETEQIQLDDPSPKKPQNQDILILDQDQDNDHEVLHDDSFSRTPDHSDLKPSNNKKAFRKSFEEFEPNNPDDLKELALTLMHDEKVDDMDTVKGTDEKIKPQGLYNLKQSANSEFGFSDLHHGESNKKLHGQPEPELVAKNGRKILAEKETINFGDTLGRSNNHSSMMSNKENIDIRDKENMNFNKPSVSMRYGDDDSAEKWKSKFLNEKEKLQATIELLEKANHGYLNQVTEKTELVSKLENQRMINERLLDRFNNVSKENEKLKKVTQTLEQEKEKMAQSMVVVDKKITKLQVANKKVMRENLAIMSKAADPYEQIKQMQELLLVSNNLEFEMGDLLLKLYEELEDYAEKLSFVINLKNSICIPQVLDNLSQNNQKFLLEMALKLCISENTQKEIILGPDGVTFVETQLTGELQLLLDALLRFHSVNATLCNLLRILNEAMPADFNDELNKTQKMLLKLAVKCLVRLSVNFKNLVGEDVRVFDILLEIYKLFKLHPPESLKEEQPNIKDYETIFKNIRTLADNVIDLGPSKAKEFAIFFTKENTKSIFLDYVKSYTNKYYPNVSNMSF